MQQANGQQPAATADDRAQHTAGKGTATTFQATRTKRSELCAGKSGAHLLGERWRGSARGSAAARDRPQDPRSHQPLLSSVGSRWEQDFQKTEDLRAKTQSRTTRPGVDRTTGAQPRVGRPLAWLTSGPPQSRSTPTPPKKGRVGGTFLLGRERGTQGELFRQNGIRTKINNTLVRPRLC